MFITLFSEYIEYKFEASILDFLWSAEREAKRRTEQNANRTEPTVEKHFVIHQQKGVVRQKLTHIRRNCAKIQYNSIYLGFYSAFSSNFPSNSLFFSALFRKLFSKLFKTDGKCKKKITRIKKSLYEESCSCFRYKKMR